MKVVGDDMKTYHKAFLKKKNFLILNFLRVNIRTGSFVFPHLGLVINVDRTKPLNVKWIMFSLKWQVNHIYKDKFVSKM